MTNLSSLLIAAVLAVSGSASTIPVPDYNATTYKLRANIVSVTPICKANLLAIMKGDDTYLERYMYANRDTMSLPKARRLWDVCTTYAMGFIFAGEIAGGVRTISLQTQ